MDKVRQDIVGAIFGGISRSQLNPLEQKVLDVAGRNPGAATALQKLSEVPGGLEALNRLVTEQPGLGSGDVWDLFKNAGENATVFRDAVIQYLDTHPRAGLRDPEVTLANGQKATIKEFDELYFTAAQAQVLERAGIPYPKEFFMVTGIGKKSDKGEDGHVTVVGSMGGRFTFSMDEAIVARVSSR